MTEQKTPKPKSHKVATIVGNKIEMSEVTAKSGEIQIIFPKDTPYSKLRKALEFAALRVK